MHHMPSVFEARALGHAMHRGMLISISRTSDSHSFELPPCK